MSYQEFLRFIIADTHFVCRYTKPTNNIANKRHRFNNVRSLNTNSTDTRKMILDTNPALCLATFSSISDTKTNIVPHICSNMAIGRLGGTSIIINPIDKTIKSKTIRFL